MPGSRVHVPNTPNSQIQATIQVQATCNTARYVWATPNMPHYIETTANTSLYTKGAPATAQGKPDIANTPFLIRHTHSRHTLYGFMHSGQAWYGWAHVDLRHAHLLLVYKYNVVMCLIQT